MNIAARLLRTLTHRRIYYSSADGGFVISDYVPRWYYWRWWRRLYGTFNRRGD